MENASQALLIAAGVLMGIIILSLIVVGYSQISHYYTNKEQLKTSQQLVAFNKQYDTYDRDNVRGTELLSLVNKILDFNKTVDTDDEKIEITVKINKIGEKYKNFYYRYDDYSKKSEALLIKEIPAIYTEKNIYNNLLKEPEEIEQRYPLGIAAKLATNMTKLIDSEATRTELLKQLKFTKPVDNNDILKYYQYQQFKRAHFDSEPALVYNGNGRVKKFTFVFNGTFE